MSHHEHRVERVGASSWLEELEDRGGLEALNRQLQHLKDLWFYALADGLELEDRTDTMALAATRSVPWSSRLVTAVASVRAHSSLVHGRHLHLSTFYPPWSIIRGSSCRDLPWSWLREVARGLRT